MKHHSRIDAFHRVEHESDVGEPRPMVSVSGCATWNLSIAPSGGDVPYLQVSGCMSPEPARTARRPFVRVEEHGRWRLRRVAMQFSESDVSGTPRSYRACRLGERTPRDAQ